MIMIVLMLAREKLDLLRAFVPRREHALAKLEQLAHRLLLELQRKSRAVDVNAVERRVAVQHVVPIEDVGVLHREDVSGAAPLVDVSVRGAWLPASVQARDVADAAASSLASNASTITRTL